MMGLRAIAITAGAAALMILARQGGAAVVRYRFGINETTSLPNWAFLVDHGDRRPRRGDAVQFLAPPNRYYPPGSMFVKRIYGLPGDRVERQGREYYVAGHDVGFAKERSKAGFATTLGPVGTLPPGRYFVGTPSKDSLDSRYGEIGWIGSERIVGVARPVL